MLGAISSATLTGAVGRPVSAEVHVSNGLPGFTIVGLPDTAVRESRDRVRAALLVGSGVWSVPQLEWHWTLGNATRFKGGRDAVSAPPPHS